MRAVQKAERVKLRWRPGSQRQDTSWYSAHDYQADPPREELIDEVTDENGTVIGIVTRNAYGSLVLNTDRLLIVDVDDRPESIGTMLLNMLRGWFGAAASKSRDQLVVDAISADPARTYRLYRTAAGWRILLASEAMVGVDDLALDLLRRFDVDHHYLTLCQRQETFRARLTAKPWRCGCQRPPNRFPCEEPDAVAAFEAWEADYARRAVAYRTCHLLAGGDSPIAPQLAPLVHLHDRLTQTDKDLPLA